MEVSMIPSFKLLVLRPALCLCALVTLFALPQMISASTISGYVYAESSRLGLVDVDVELENDIQTIARTKTDGSGRYTFPGLGDGRYTVKVMPFRYDYADQGATVEIQTFGVRGAGIGNTLITHDFYLLPRRGTLSEGEMGVVFAQDVPENARRLYETAVVDLSRNRKTEGIQGLREAVKAFDKYYAAIHRLGMEMFAKGQYAEAAQLFMTAASINEKSVTSLYYTGFSLFHLGKDYHKAALVATESALTLAPSSVQVLYLLGRIERSLNNFENAEKHLLLAKKNAKSTVPEIHRELAQLYGNDLKKYQMAADELELYLKASKADAEEQKKVKKVITDLRAKAGPTRSS